MFETSGLPVGWKRVKTDDGILFKGPEGQTFEHIYQVYEHAVEKHKPEPEPEAEPEAEPEPQPEA